MMVDTLNNTMILHRPSKRAGAEAEAIAWVPAAKANKDKLTHTIKHKNNTSNDRARQYPLPRLTWTAIIIVSAAYRPVLPQRPHRDIQVKNHLVMMPKFGTRVGGCVASQIHSIHWIYNRIVCEYDDDDDDDHVDIVYIYTYLCSSVFLEFFD